METHMYPLLGGSLRLSASVKDFDQVPKFEAHSLNNSPIYLVVLALHYYTSDMLICPLPYCTLISNLFECTTLAI